MGRHSAARSRSQPTLSLISAHSARYCLGTLLPQAVVSRLRQAYPGVRIVLRDDSGFCRPLLLSWYERYAHYVVGMAQEQPAAGVGPRLARAHRPGFARTYHAQRISFTGGEPARGAARWRGASRPHNILTWLSSELHETASALSKEDGRQSLRNITLSPQSPVTYKALVFRECIKPQG